MTGDTPAPIVVVMGVCGCGKSSVGRLLADRLGCRYVEGDEHHPPANIAKMTAGVPLTDEDRQGWLGTLARLIAAAERGGTGLVVSCSALKRSYRALLRGDCDRVVFLHLTGDRALIAERVAARPSHFMPITLIDSQFAVLEPPGSDEPALSYPITRTVEEIVADTVMALPAVARRQMA